MTYADILVQILSEVSTAPKEEVEEKIEFMRKLAPNSKLDVELPEDEAQTIMEKLRGEKEAILAWLVRGALEKPPFDA